MTPFFQCTLLSTRAMDQSERSYIISFSCREVEETRLRSWDFIGYLYSIIEDIARENVERNRLTARKTNPKP